MHGCSCHFYGNFIIVNSDKEVCKSTKEKGSVCLCVRARVYACEVFNEKSTKC